MLAYYLEWHLREAWATLTFQDESPPLSPDPVAKAGRSPEATRKSSRKRTASGEPCHSLQSLLAELALIVRDTMRVPGSGVTFTKLTEPEALQARALELAGAARGRL